jgi:hypothetical protein
MTYLRSDVTFRAEGVFPLAHRHTGALVHLFRTSSLRLNLAAIEIKGTDYG